MAITRLGGANAITGTLPAANINDTSIGNITALPAGVGGKVLQVVTSVPTSSFSTTSTSLVDTPYSITITPTATNSKMIVEFSGNWGKDTVSGRSQLVALGNSSGSFSTIKTSSYAAWSSTSNANMDIIRVVEDSVGTTNAVTYKLQTRAVTSGITVYLPLNANDAALATVYEIEG